jgi:hypothetical protein
MRRTEWAKRLGVVVVVAVVVVAVVAAGPALEERAPPEPREHPEYDPNETLSEPIDATGTVEFDASIGGGRGKVLIDDSHSNRFSRSTIDPLVQALSRAGYEVEIYTGGDLETELQQADAFVVIDPAAEFGDTGNDAVRRFTDDGGRLLVLAEPTTRTISGGLFSASITSQPSAVTTLTSQYGMSVSTDYLYNQARNDGNYKRVVVESAPNSTLSDVRQGVVYTSASVSVVNGRRVLIAAPGTRTGGTSATSPRKTVAVRKGNVLLFGDSSFLTERYHNVGDNERTLAYVVEFLIGGEKTDSRAGGDPAADGAANGTATPAGTATATT